MRQIFRTTEHNDFFLRDGAVLVSLLDQDEVQSLLHMYWDAIPNLDMGFHATMFSRELEIRARVDLAVKNAMSSKLAHYLHNYRSVVGNCVVKEHSRAGSEVPVHQDWTFVDEEKMRSVNVWCPLVDTDSVNGALRIFKGSHRFVPVLRGPFFPNPYVDLADTISKNYMTEIPMCAGQALIYDHSLVHASPPNLSGRTRVAVNLVLVPEEAQIIHGYLDRQDQHAQPEIYEVDDDFFLKNIVGERPSGRLSHEVVRNISVPAVSAEELRLMVAAGTDSGHSHIGIKHSDAVNVDEMEKT